MAANPNGGQLLISRDEWRMVNAELLKLREEVKARAILAEAQKQFNDALRATVLEWSKWDALDSETEAQSRDERQISVLRESARKKTGEVLA